MSIRKSNEFGFGIESEFVLLDGASGCALWEDTLTFERLNSILESIPLDDVADLCSMDGLRLEPPHKKLMPFVVEGYSVPDSEFRVIDVRPKGVEIRTPLSTSLEGCLASHQELHRRMQRALSRHGLLATAISHHPIAMKFTGPQNKRREDFWRWAMQAMTTYGPDVNVSVPNDFVRHLDLVDLERKVDAYAPAMAAFSLASPFYGGELWQVNGAYGKSIRSWRRSIVAPPIEIHPEEDGRLEFKVFEMSPLQSDYRNYFLLFLTLILDNELRDRADAPERIYSLGAVSIRGLAASEVELRAARLLDRAQVILPKWGFDPASLETFAQRFDSKRVPADTMIKGLLTGMATIKSILLERTVMAEDHKTLQPQWMDPTPQKESGGQIGSVHA